MTAQTQLGRVAIVYNYAGADGRLIRALIREEGLAGLVIAGIGLGNVTAGLADAIEEARVLLMLALTKTHDPAAIQKYFDNESYFRSGRANT